MSQDKQSFVLLPDNETEQVTTEESNEVICDIFEQI